MFKEEREGQYREMHNRQVHLPLSWSLHSFLGWKHFLEINLVLRAVPEQWNLTSWDLTKLR